MNNRYYVNNIVMNIYFLIRRRPIGFTAYSTGSNIFAIHDFHMMKIYRYYPEPSEDLTPRLAKLQKAWRHRRSYIRWLGHPTQLQYRLIHGRFPPVPPQFRTYRLLRYRNQQIENTV